MILIIYLIQLNRSDHFFLQAYKRDFVYAFSVNLLFFTDIILYLKFYSQVCSSKFDLSNKNLIGKVTFDPKVYK